MAGLRETRVVLRRARRIVTPSIMAALVAGLIFALPADPVAHEIPADVTIQAFVKPEGQRLRLLVRVPLIAMRDINFPTRGAGYLDLAQIDRLLPGVAMLWIGDEVELYEGDTRLGSPQVVAARVSLPTDRSFRSYEDALAHVTGAREPNDTDVFLEEAMFDVLFQYPVRSDQSNFSIRPDLWRLGLRVVTVLRFLPPSGVVRAYEYSGEPGLVRLDPRWHQAALQFVKLGFFHILDGIDHLLFLGCLVIPFRRFRTLIPVVTAFTVAHSITLISSAYGLAPNGSWFPPLVETLIAMSIVYMAAENIIGVGVRRRWLITFGFGLVHGFGFSFALRQTLQFAGSHLLTSLLAFNVGVELGQLLVLVLLIPTLHVVFRFVVAERTGAIILSVLVAHTGWHWMSERASLLSQYPFQWPTLSIALMASVMGWLMLILILAGLVWLVSGMLRRPAERSAKGEAAAGAEE